MAQNLKELWFGVLVVLSIACRSVTAPYIKCIKCGWVEATGPKSTELLKFVEERLRWKQNPQCKGGSVTTTCNGTRPRPACINTLEYFSLNDSSTLKFTDRTCEDLDDLSKRFKWTSSLKLDSCADNAGSQFHDLFRQNFKGLKSSKTEYCACPAPACPTDTPSAAINNIHSPSLILVPFLLHLLLF